MYNLSSHVMIWGACRGKPWPKALIFLFNVEKFQIFLILWSKTNIFTSFFESQLNVNISSPQVRTSLKYYVNSRHRRWLPVSSHTFTWSLPPRPVLWLVSVAGGPKVRPLEWKLKRAFLKVIAFDWHVLHARLLHWLSARLLNHCWFPLSGGPVTRVVTSAQCG